MERLILYFFISSTWPDDSVTVRPKFSSNPRSISNNNISLPNKSSSITRSLSQDINVGALESSKPKSSHSDTSLDAPPRIRSLRHSTIREQTSSSTALDEDVCSTDSSLMDEDVKKKKKKLFGFSKKNKGKND